MVSIVQQHYQKPPLERPEDLQVFLSLSRGILRLELLLCSRVSPQMHKNSERRIFSETDETRSASITAFLISLSSSRSFFDKVSAQKHVVDLFCVQDVYLKVELVFCCYISPKKYKTVWQTIISVNINSTLCISDIKRWFMVSWWAVNQTCSLLKVCLDCFFCYCYWPFLTSWSLSSKMRTNLLQVEVRLRVNVLYCVSVELPF